MSDDFTPSDEPKEVKTKNSQDEEIHSSASFSSTSGNELQKKAEKKSKEKIRVFRRSPRVIEQKRPLVAFRFVAKNFQCTQRGMKLKPLSFDTRLQSLEYNFGGDSGRGDRIP